MNNGTTIADTDRSEGIDLLDLLVVVAKYKLFIVAAPVVIATVAAVVSLFLPHSYTATTRLLPPQQGQSTTSSLLGQLGGLASLATGAVMKNSSDVYVGMLKSRTVADGILHRFDLMKEYGAKTLTDARRSLESATQITAGKEGLITIQVDARDPKLAAALANAYPVELSKLTSTLAVTEASQRRLFLEKQLKAAKDSLTNAEIALKQTQEKTGAIRIDDQGKALIESLARLKAQVAAKEVQLTAMRTFATEANPEFVVAQQELAGLRRELAKLEQKQPQGKADVFLATESIPTIGLEYVRKFRDVKYHETMFELLAKQFEVARIDEARDSAVVQVLDEAVVPEIRSKPRRTRIVVFAAVLGLVAAILAVFVFEAVGRFLREPQHAEKLQTIGHHLSGRR